MSDLGLAIAELPPWLMLGETAPYLTMAEVRFYDVLSITSIEDGMAEFVVGEIKEVGVLTQAKRPPYDFTIASATFDLQSPTGAAVPEFTYNAGKLTIDGHEVRYMLDSTLLKPATKPYKGVFSIVVSSQKFTKAIGIRVNRIGDV